jgi:Uma2 family endonuclease
MALAPASPQQAPVEEGPVLIATGVTATQYLSGPETNVPHNLIDGELYRMPSPFKRHQKAVGKLHVSFERYAESAGGEVILSPMDCRLADRTVVQPDIAYIVPERAHIYQDIVMGAPDLVVEVLSKGTRRFDRNRKLQAYARNGVREAWLVDPDAETVTVLTGDGTQWIKEQSVLFGDDIPSAIVAVGAAGLGEAEPQSSSGSSPEGSPAT